MAYSRWWKDGSVNVTNGSKYVTGTNTNWNTAGLHPGDIFSVDDTRSYEVESVTDNTHLVLVKAYEGTTANNQTYSIVRNYTSTTGAQLAAQATDLYGDIKSYVDGKQSLIKGKSAYELAVEEGFSGNKTQWIASLKGEPGTNGKSAYELAVDGGFSGTQAEWLESLKAANEWSTLNAKLNVLDYPSAHFHIIREKNLGDTFTSAQASAISSGKFTDLYLGDYWEKEIDTAEAQAELESEGYDFTGMWIYDRGTVGKVQFKIIDFNYYRGQHHINEFGNDVNWRQHLLMSFYCFLPIYFGTFEPNQPYYTMPIRKILNKYALQTIYEFFGQNHIPTYPTYLCNAVNANGEPTGYLYNHSLIELPSEMMVYGTNLGTPINPSYDRYQARYWAQYHGNGACFTNMRDMHTGYRRYGVYYADHILSVAREYNTGVFVLA